MVEAEIKIEKILLEGLREGCMRMWGIAIIVFFASLAHAPWSTVQQGTLIIGICVGFYLAVQRRSEEGI